MIPTFNINPTKKLYNDIINLLCRMLNNENYDKVAKHLNNTYNHAIIDSIQYCQKYDHVVYYITAIVTKYSKELKKEYSHDEIYKLEFYKSGEMSFTYKENQYDETVMLNDDIDITELRDLLTNSGICKKTNMFFDASDMGKYIMDKFFDDAYIYDNPDAKIKLINHIIFKASANEINDTIELVFKYDNEYYYYFDNRGLEVIHKIIINENERTITLIYNDKYEEEELEITISDLTDEELDYIFRLYNNLPDDIIEDEEDDEFDDDEEIDIEDDFEDEEEDYDE